MRAITSREAAKLARKLGVDIGTDGRTYYATDAEETGLYEFDTKAERDAFVEKNVTK